MTKSFCRLIFEIFFKNNRYRHFYRCYFNHLPCADTLNLKPHKVHRLTDNRKNVHLCFPVLNFLVIISKSKIFACDRVSVFIFEFSHEDQNKIDN